MVECNAKRLLHLIGDLLLITQIEAGKLELNGGDVDLAKLAADGVRPTTTLRAPRTAPKHWPWRASVPRTWPSWM